MWARVADGSIQEIINIPRIITIGGITHPRTMFSLWTDAERKAAAKANKSEGNEGGRKGLDQNITGRGGEDRRERRDRDRRVGARER